MMNPNELYSIREWAPCTNIVERIPARPPRGGLSVFTKDLNITCIAAVDKFLALGTDGGTVYWYDRETAEIERLDPENANANITCVRIVDSVEYMLAAGDTNGKVHVFQIQKKLPPDLELVTYKKKPIERYTVRDLHGARITSCEWSRNGMKLYSGDLLGVVVLTEFDYQKHISRSMEILSEAYEIVQLSVYKHHLLVSTLYRVVLCSYDQTNCVWNLCQVGKKDRKQLEDCGGIFLTQAFGPPTVICGRPGQRIWLSDLKGNVEKTLLFKEALANGANWDIPLLNPTQRQCNSKEPGNFRQLQLYAGHQMLLVTHDGKDVYILNLEKLCIAAVARGFRGILDVCVYKREIFVLEGPRSLIRLAAQPEKPNRTTRIIFNPYMPPMLPGLGITTNDVIEQPSEVTEEQQINGNEDCLELPPIEELDLRIPIELAVESPRSNHARRFGIFNKISIEEFDNTILHTHTASATDLLQQIDAQSGMKTTKKQRKNINDEVLKTQATPINNSSGIVEIGHIALFKEESDSLNTNCKTAVDTLKQVCQEYIPQLLESIALGEATSMALPVNTEEAPKEFSAALENIYPKTYMPSNDEICLQANVERDKGVNTDLAQQACSVAHTEAKNNVTLCQELLTAFEQNKAETKNNVMSATCASNNLPSETEREDVDDIDSFLFDFRRATDPFALNVTTLSDAEESNTSSDWEFLNM